MGMRFEKLEQAIAHQNLAVDLQGESSIQMFLTTIYIEKLEGNGNAFGDNNKIENAKI